MSTTVRPRMRWSARQVLLIAAAVYFTFIGGTFVTDQEFWPRVFHHVLVSVILLGWCISLWRRGESIPSTPLDGPILALGAVWIISTAFAVDPRVSVEALWQLGVFVLFFYILVDMMRSWGPPAVIQPLFFAAGVVVFMALFEFVSWYFGLSWLPNTSHLSWLSIGGLSQPIPPAIYRLTYTLNVATFLAGYLSLLMPVVLAWAVTSTPVTRGGLLVWLVGALVDMMLAFSRGGLLSLGVSAVVFGALLALGQPGWRTRAAALLRDWRVWAVLAGLVVIGAAAALYSLRGDPFGHQSGDRERFQLWNSAWQIGLTHPISGAGPYSFGRAMRAFRDPTVVGDHFISSHDIPLQVFAETGLLGVMALAWLLGVAAMLVWRRWRSADGAERIRIAGIAAALAGFSAQNLGDTLVNIPVLLPWLAMGAYLVAPQVAHPAAQPGKMRCAAQTVVTGLVCLSIVGWGISDVAQYHFARSARLAQGRDWQNALAEIDRAIAIDPSMGYYAAQRAQILGEMASTDSASIKPAQEAYETALRFENSYALMRANHAVILSQGGDLPAALAEANTAVALQPDDPHYLLLAADFNEQVGKPADATSLYQKALLADPAWIDSGYWDKTDVRQAARDTFIKSAGVNGSVVQLAQLEPECWVDQSNGGPSTAAAQPVCRGEIALVLGGKPAEALPLLDKAVAASAFSPVGYLWRAEAQRQLGDISAAEKDARTAIFLGDPHGYVVLGRLAEARGDDASAIQFYRSSPPLVVQLQGWDVAVYQRRGMLAPLPYLDAPGPSRYDFEGWLALLREYERLGRVDDASALRGVIQQIDPYLTIDRK